MARKEVAAHHARSAQPGARAVRMPLMMLLLFGYALSLDVDRIPTIVYDLDRTPQSRDLVEDFRGSRYFQIVEAVHNYRPIERAWIRARALLGVVIPPDYSRDICSRQGSRRCNCCSMAAIPTRPPSPGLRRRRDSNLRRAPARRTRRCMHAGERSARRVERASASGTTPIWYRATSSCPD